MSDAGQRENVGFPGVQLSDDVHTHLLHRRIEVHHLVSDSQFVNKFLHTKQYSGVLKRADIITVYYKNVKSKITHTHTHNCFTAFFSGTTRMSRCLLLHFIVQGKITKADTPTIQLGVTPSGLISDRPPSSPHFYVGCPSCCNPPNLYCLGTGTKYAGLHTQWHGFNRVRLRVRLKAYYMLTNSFNSIINLMHPKSA